MRRGFHTTFRKLLIRVNIPRSFVIIFSPLLPILLIVFLFFTNLYNYRIMSGTMRDKTNDKQGFRFPWPFPQNQSFAYRIKSYMTMSLVTSVSKIMFLKGMMHSFTDSNYNFLGANQLVVHNKETFVKILENNKQSLITVSNHRSNIDDPLMWCESFSNIRYANFRSRSAEVP